MIQMNLNIGNTFKEKNPYKYLSKEEYSEILRVKFGRK